MRFLVKSDAVSEAIALSKENWGTYFHIKNVNNIYVISKYYDSSCVMYAHKGNIKNH